MPPSTSPGDEWQTFSASIPHHDPFVSGEEDNLDAGYDQVMDYPEEPDYYALLGLSRDATEADIRSAYRTLTLSFHPDKQPAHLRDLGQQHFALIRDAYDTLIDPQKRTVYDLLGAKGVRQEWSHGGAMGQQGEAERQELGVRAMNPQEFRHWFLGIMKARERKVVNTLVRSRGALTVGIDASDLILVDEEEGDVYVHIPSVSASSYALGYNFRAPLPMLEGRFGEPEVDEDAQEDNSEENKQDTKDAHSVEVLVNTHVAGRLQQLQRSVVDPNTKDTYIVQLPRILTATDVNVGAAVVHAFGDVASAKGIFKRRPFSLLGNSTVTAKASFLPDLKLETAVAKSIQLIPGTRPFNVNLSTTFAQSIFETVPIFGFQVTKNISDTKLALCSWSSGSQIWPLAIQRLVEPFFSLGMSEDVQIAQPSFLQVAFISLPKHSRSIGDDGDEADEEDEEEDETRKERQKMKSESGKAESYTIQMQASPMTGSLSFNYGRNLFSGKAADDAIRSEWSFEGYHPPRPESEYRSVRLEVMTTIGLDLSLGWHIRAVRQVGEFTRMGLGVGIQGMQGLVMTVSWNRLGQRIQLPISICSADVVNAEAAVISVVFPWLAYCAVEFGLLRPWTRKRRRELMSYRHKQLKKEIPRKRAESLQAIELMAHQVRRRQEKEKAHGGLVITKAEYGYIPSESRKNRGGRTESQVIDVTVPVAALVDQSQLVLPKKMAKFKILGFYDPAPLRPKKLRIWYRYGEREHFVEAADGEGVSCPMRSHLCG